MGSFSKGLLRQEQITEFKDFLNGKSIGWTQGKGIYEVMHVRYSECWHLITINGKGAIASSPDLDGLIADFQRPVVTTPDSDTELLEYLFNNQATVNEYTASDVPFFYLSYADDSAQIGQYKTPREAITAAIQLQKVQTSEVN